MTSVFRVIRDEYGATAIEYALIAAFLSIVILVGATAVGTQLNVVFQNLSASLGGP